MGLVIKTSVVISTDEAKATVFNSSVVLLIPSTTSERDSNMLLLVAMAMAMAMVEDVKCGYRH